MDLEFNYFSDLIATRFHSMFFAQGENGRGSRCEGGHALHLPAGSRVTDCKLRKRTQKNSALGIVGRVASIISNKKRGL